MVDGIVIFFHVIFSILLVTLVLMHSGQQSGIGSIGGGAGGQGGGGMHVMERNLDRLTVVVALLYLATTLTLTKIFT